MGEGFEDLRSCKQHLTHLLGVFSRQILKVAHPTPTSIRKSLLSKRPPSLERDAFLIGSIVALEGADMAKLRVRQLIPDATTRHDATMFLSAGVFQKKFRKHPEVVEFFEAALGGPKDQQIEFVLTLGVGASALTLRVSASCATAKSAAPANDAERRKTRFHAERGNEDKHSRRTPKVV